VTRYIVRRVLLSELADRSILSVAVRFLAAGVVLGPAGFGVLAITTDSRIVIRLSEYALFSVLFTDGMKIPLRDLSQRRHLPGRALALGLPVTLVVTAAAAHSIVEMPWTESLLLGAVLSPTIRCWCPRSSARRRFRQGCGTC